MLKDIGTSYRWQNHKNFGPKESSSTRNVSTEKSSFFDSIIDTIEDTCDSVVEYVEDSIEVVSSKIDSINWNVVYESAKVYTGLVCGCYLMSVMPIIGTICLTITLYHLMMHVAGGVYIRV